MKKNIQVEQPNRPKHLENICIPIWSTLKIFGPVKVDVDLNVLSISQFFGLFYDYPIYFDVSFVTPYKIPDCYHTLWT
jgi:hypothetical protein